MSEDVAAVVGENIRRRRESAGWTQESLGERLGVTQTAVSYWEGGRREPGLAQLTALADVLGVAIDELFGRAAIAAARAPLLARIAELEADAALLEDSADELMKQRDLLGEENIQLAARCEQVEARAAAFAEQIGVLRNPTRGNTATTGEITVTIAPPEQATDGPR